MKRDVIFGIFLLLLLVTILGVNTASSRTNKIIVIIHEYQMASVDSGRIFPDTPSQNTKPSYRQIIPDPAGETEVIKTLIAAGFHVVNQEQIVKIRYSDQVKAVLNGEKDIAILLGKKFGADILIIGEAITQSTGNSFQGLFSSRARVEAKIIDLDNGKIIFTDGLYASAMDRSEIISGKKALQKAGVEIGNIFVEKLRHIYGKSSSTD